MELMTVAYRMKSRTLHLTVLSAKPVRAYVCVTTVYLRTNQKISPTLILMERALSLSVFLVFISYIMTILI